MDDGKAGAKPRKRLNPEDRRRKIPQAAGHKDVSDQGMYELRHGGFCFYLRLVRGGFYHYCRDKSDLLYDMIELGSQHRFHQTLAFREEHPELSKTDLLLALILGLPSQLMTIIYLLGCATAKKGAVRTW